MLITDQFVVVNLPKSGSTFVRHVLSRLHEVELRRNRWQYLFRLRRKPTLLELMLPDLETCYRSDIPQHMQIHGNYASIPPEHKNKTIVSVMRNPLAKYVSHYHFRYWERRAERWGFTAKAKAVYPQFPDLTFDEFVEYFNHPFQKALMFPDMNITADVGLLSLQFIHMFFRDPVKILTSLSDAYLDGDAYRQELAPVHFLRTESLRSGLTAFLLEHGTGEEETAFIDTEERKNVSLPDGRDWRDEYSQRSLESVLRRERLLFKVFPEYLQEAESIQHRFELRGGVGDAAEYRQEDG